jgi:hypothetical protein
MVVWRILATISLTFALCSRRSADVDDRKMSKTALATVASTRFFSATDPSGLRSFSIPLYLPL